MYNNSWFIRFRYSIQKPSRNAYVLHVHFSACFESNDACLLDIALVGGMELPRIFCESTNNNSKKI